MKLDTIRKTTKTGLPVEFRSASEADAQAEIEHIHRICGETRFLMREAEEVSFTEEGEKAFLKQCAESPNALMLNAYVDGRLIGNGSFEAVADAGRMRHRASVGIALIREFCDQGIGRLLMEILLEQAKACGFEIMELEVFSNNGRAVHLYQKLGFTECGVMKNAVKYADGTYTDLILMQKNL